MIRIKFDEFKHKGRNAVISTIQLRSGSHETIVMYRSSGREIEFYRHRTAPQAIACHDRLVEKYILA